ncbi:MAG: permease [Verrucomicrobiales bacterium]|nr:permease [Verrucomicrobiales bacterium]
MSPFTDLCFLFLSIVLEGAPFILLGTVISGIIDAYLPPGLIDRWLPKNKPLAVILSALLGAIFPVCECTIVPVIRRLIKKGLPISCAVTYMLSSPIINPITVISTMNAFKSTKQNFSLREDPTHMDVYSPEFMTSSRLILAFIITVSVGMILLRVRKKSILAKSLADDDSISDGHHDDHHEHDHDEKKEHDHNGEEDTAQPNRPILAMRTALRDFVETAMYFTIGVAITAVFKAFVTEDLVLVFNQSEPVGIGLMMMLAFILSLCSTSDAFIAANFPVPQAAKLAFLVYGPMMDVKLIFMYLSVFKKKFVLILAVTLFFAIGILSYVWFQI